MQPLPVAHALRLAPVKVFERVADVDHVGRAVSHHRDPVDPVTQVDVGEVADVDVIVAGDVARSAAEVQFHRRRSA